MTRSGRLRQSPTRLTPPKWVAVPFIGQRAAEQPMTLGQLNILQWLSGAPGHPYATIGAELAVSGDVRVADVAETVAVLLARHEGLRTRYGGCDRPTQQVPDSGVLMLGVCSADGGAPDQSAIAQQLLRQLRAEPFDPAGLPLRIAVAVAEDTETVMAAAMDVSHLAADFRAVEIVQQEFAEMTADRSARRIGPPRHQPLDQAERESAPGSRRQAETALRYWREQLSRMPQCLYATPRTAPGGESLCASMSSVAGALAAAAIAARTRTSRASIVLAAIGAVLAQRTGYRDLLFPALSSNRFEPRLTGYVGTLAQGCLTGLDMSGLDTNGHGFDAIVRSTWTAVLESCRHSRYDAFRRVEMARLIEHERGVRFDYEPLFNSVAAETGVPNRVSRPAAIDQARRSTSVRWWPMPASSSLLRFDLCQADELLRLDLWTGDTGRVSSAELRSLLLAVENLLVAAAAGNLDARRIREAVRLEPIARGPGWALVDCCWVELAEVQQVLDEAFGPGVARIFAEADGRQLVACLAGSESVRTPEQAHARCMAALAGHPTALAPRHYVVCAATPADPADWSQWPVLRSGDGRSPGES
ncbi:MAG: condensation domain-containing protein [Kibdelosporangium sp.]